MVAIRIEMDSAGCKELLRSADVGRDVKRRLDAVAARAGNGHRSKVYQGRDRVRGDVWTATPAARRAEAENRALLRAMDAARE